MANNHVTVGIVGGGVAGLSLANMLEKIGVSYILYEGYHDVAPNAGASLGLMPNGLRILDQLGLMDKIDPYSVAHDKWEHRDGETGALCVTTTNMRQLPGLLGYGGFFVDRQDVLRILFENLEDKSKIHTSKRVVSIEELGHTAVVRSKDGSSFTCDFVAGADGVRSVVREHIFANVGQPPADYLCSNITCVFGMSKPVPSIGPGRHFSIYRSKVCALFFSGLNGKLYWFMFQQLDEPLKFGQRHKFTDEDIEKVYTQIENATVADGVHVSDIFKAREIAVMTAIEEGLCDTWNSGRKFLLGDSGHKMVPHAAMGANQAIESAACFVNMLRRSQLDSPSASGSGIDESAAHACLEMYSKKRHSRLSEVIQVAVMARKNQHLVGPLGTELIHSLASLRSEDLLVKALASFSKAEKLENWRWGSERVNTYDQQAYRALEILADPSSIDRLRPTRA